MMAVGEYLSRYRPGSAALKGMTVKTKVLREAGVHWEVGEEGSVIIALFYASGYGLVSLFDYSGEKVYIGGDTCRLGYLCLAISIFQNRGRVGMAMLRDEIPYILAVHSVTFAGSRKMRKLIDYFGGGKKIWEADASELQASLLLSGKVEELMAARRKYDPRREYKNMIRRGYRATTIFDDEYPEVLKTIYNPPAVLYSRGQIEKLNHKGLAIVGARKASSYGRNVAVAWPDLARAGYCIISGMARD